MKCLILLLCISQEGFISRPDPSPFVPLSEPIVDVDPVPQPSVDRIRIAIHEAAFQSVTASINATSNRPQLVGISAPWCATCPSWKRYMPDIPWAEVNTLPDSQQTAPCFRRADGRYWDWNQGRQTTRAALLAWAAEVPAIASDPAPMMAGSISGISGYIDQYRSYVGEMRVTLREKTIDCGQVSVVLNRADFTLSESGESLVMRFGTRRPQLRWGIVKVDVYGLKTDGKSLTVEVPGPDWTLKIE